MGKKTHAVFRFGSAILVAVATMIAGFVSGNWSMVALAVTAAVLLGILAQLRYSLGTIPPPHEAAPRDGSTLPRVEAARPAKANSGNRDGNQEDLVRRMLDQGRYALLLRPQIATGLRGDQLQTATSALDIAMGIVPAGDVLLQPWRGDHTEDETHGRRERIVHVEAVYLDRFPVTNAQFQHFVDDGGYAQMSLWEPNIWPAVLDFVDRAGHPGPGFWADGQFAEGMADHPVVGVSWYECAAYARWAGKRLPSDPEWVKAGCWPVLTQGTRPIQRRFPWGDTMDRELARLWSHTARGTIDVRSLSGGVSVGGVYHLIGNVWEWTTSSFGVWDATARRLETLTPMKSIRGGAFDTYFDTQATCQFQSGENPVNRKHNIGFRCALALCDVIATELADNASLEPEGAVIGHSGLAEEVVS
ncbi:MAG: formylglycine-generating enzyme family protein [Planctomycetes bacterium]|nr:formylglycine-generating enzyme family protein [Planctomycetota bacterium]